MFFFKYNETRHLILFFLACKISNISKKRKKNFFFNKIEVIIFLNMIKVQKGNKESRQQYKFYRFLFSGHFFLLYKRNIIYKKSIFVVSKNFFFKKKKKCIISCTICASTHLFYIVIRYFFFHLSNKILNIFQYFINVKRLFKSGAFFLVLIVVYHFVFT